MAAPLSRSPPAAPPTQRPGVCAQKHNQGSDFWGVLDCQGQRQPAFHPSSRPVAHTCGIHFVLALFHLTATFPSQCLMSCGIQPPGDLPDSGIEPGVSCPAGGFFYCLSQWGCPYTPRGVISQQKMKNKDFCSLEFYFVAEVRKGLLTCGISTQVRSTPACTKASQQLASLPASVVWW